MGHDIVLDRVQVSSANALALQPGEYLSHVLDDAQLRNDVGRLGPPGQDITDVKGTLQATTQRLAWLEAGATSSSPGRSCSLTLAALQDMDACRSSMISFTASFKLKLRVDASGRPAGGGQDILKVVVSSGTLMSARASSTAQARFMASLQDLLRNARAPSPPAQARSALPAVDRAAHETLVVMGFDGDRATCALAGTGGDVTRAVQWLGDHQHVSTADLIRQAAPAAPADLPTSLYIQLQQMGYSAGDVDCAAAATGSDDVHTCASWLLDNGAAGATRHATPPQPSAAPPSYYPAIRYDNPAQPSYGGAYPGGAAPVSSHPVALPGPALYGSHTPGFDGETTANPAAGYYPAMAAQQAPPQRSAPARPMGMAGVIYQKQQETKAATSQVHQGFRDLESLKASGEKLAALAVDLKERAAARGNGGGEGGEVDSQVAESLMDVGLIDPVTKRNAGKQYQQQLARQLADFLAPVLRKDRGMMVLHDVFCLFNRARGLELVSPDDLRSAAELFAQLRLPLLFRVFPSGVAVIQDETWSDDAACERVVQALSQQVDGEEEDSVAAALGRGLRPTQFALEQKIPLAVATEQLLLAERHGMACRDESPQGLTFYSNFFMQVDL